MDQDKGSRGAQEVGSLQPPHKHVDPPPMHVYLLISISCSNIISRRSSTEDSRPLSDLLQQFSWKLILFNRKDIITQLNNLNVFFRLAPQYNTIGTVTVMNDQYFQCGEDSYLLVVYLLVQ